MRFYPKLLLISLLISSHNALAGTTIFSEGFEEPELTVENFPNFNGLWVVFGDPTSGFDAPAELPVGTSFVGDSGETWRITKGNIDIVDGVGLSQGGFAAASGTQSIDLNGFEPGAFEVTVVFPAPGLYNLSFAMSRNPNAPSDRIMKVTLDGESLDGSPYTVTQSPTASEMNYQQVSIQFYVSSAGSHTLAFESLDQVNAQGRNGYGVVIDDVEITSVSTSPTYDVSFTSETTLLNATLPGDQINPSVASLPGNQFVMTWSDRAGNDGDRGGIFGRLYDATMTPLTSEFVVNTLTTDWQSKSNVASAPNGTFMAVWHQSNGWVEGQLFTVSGEKQGPQFTVQEGFNGLSDVVADASGNFWVVSSVNNGSGYVSKYSNTGELLVDSLVLPSEGVASDPVITVLKDGRILVSWYDGQNTSGSDIYGQILTGEGALSGDPFVVNVTTAENQSKPAVAALTSGGFVVAWQSLLQDGDLAGVYARVFDSAGAGGSEISVNTNTTGNQVNAYVTAQSDGGFVVGWADAAAPPQGQVYLQSYTAVGEPQGDNQVVSVDDVTAINNSVNIELAELTDGSFVAVWNAWNGSQNIYGRTLEILVEQEPTPPREIGFTSPTSVLNATLPGDQINPSVASLPGNQFVMTWSDRAGNDGDRGGIFGRLYDATMTPLTSEFVVNTLTTDWQSKSNVASAPNGTFMAVWHQSNGWVEGQLFTVSGEKQGPQFTVQEGFNGLSDVVADASGNFWVVSSVNNGSGYVSKYSNTGELLVDSLVLPSEGVASDPVITVLKDGRILVSWYDGQNTSGSDIYGQILTGEGALSGDPFVVNVTTAENQSKPAVAALTSGGFVVAWQSLLQDGDLAGVYARVFDSAGAGGSEISVNTNTTGNQVNAYVTAQSDGGFVVGWADAAAPPQGQVYLQSYTAVGEPQGDNQVVSVDDVTAINNSVNIELAELTDGSFVAVWNAWNGSQNIYGRTFKLLTITQTDTDGDGVVDSEDAFPNDPSETTDTDGDGVGDNADVFPNDDSETTDTDGDGLGDNADTDDDGDGYSDSDEIAAGTDPLSSESFPSEDEEDSGGLPIWMLYIATQPKAA